METITENWQTVLENKLSKKLKKLENSGYTIEFDDDDNIVIVQVNSSDYIQNKFTERVDEKIDEIVDEELSEEEFEDEEEEEEMRDSLKEEYSAGSRKWDDVCLEVYWEFFDGDIAVASILEELGFACNWNGDYENDFSFRYTITYRQIEKYLLHEMRKVKIKNLQTL